MMWGYRKGWSSGGTWGEVQIHAVMRCMCMGGSGRDTGIRGMERDDVEGSGACRGKNFNQLTMFKPNKINK